MITSDRDYRSFEVRTAEEEGMIVEGYAAKYEEVTVLQEIEGIKYSEVIKRGAFDGCDMKDVVMNFNHKGKPVARTRNNTLQLIVDDIGLRIRADLSGTEEGRGLYEEIKGGYLDKMSFAFNVLEDNYIRESRTREILKLQRLFDVAVCDFAAYDTTNIQARSFFTAEAGKELIEIREREKLRLKLKLSLGV